MASERIQLIIDVVTGNATGPIAKLKADLAEADGAFGKTKAAASNLWDGIKANAGPAMLAAGSALTSFAIKAVGDFQETALGAGQLRDSLGVTAEEASRLQEVAGDLGIGVGTLESSIGRMNRTAATTPAVFQEIGAEIARNRDGTVNTTETYLNVIDALKRIEDPTKRAAAAQKILGKSWMDTAELIEMGADGVRDAMAGVEDAKIIDDGEIARARKFRDTMDDLKGVMESASITVGESLVPTLTALGDSLSSLNELANKPIGNTTFMGLVQNNALSQGLNQLTGGLDAWNKSQKDNIEITYNHEESLRQAAEASGWFHKAVDGIKDSWSEARPEVEDSTDAMDAFTESQEKARDALLEAADALNKEVDAMRGSADAAIAAEDAQRDFADSIAEAKELAKEGGATQRELEDATRKQREAAVQAADAQVELAQQQAVANGKTLTGQERIDAFNTSLLNNARFATPAAQRAIYDYIIQANQIPEDKATWIRALIDQGKLDEANGLINSASRARTATINADANTSAAETELNNTARPRVASIFVNTLPAGSTSSPKRLLARGGRANAGDIAGEAGAELVETRDGRQVIVDEPTVMPQGANVIPMSGVGATSGSSAGSSVVNHITINTGADPRAVIDAIRRYERSNGSAWRAS